MKKIFEECAPAVFILALFFLVLSLFGGWKTVAAMFTFSLVFLVSFLTPSLIAALFKKHISPIWGVLSCFSGLFAYMAYLQDDIGAWFRGGVYRLGYGVFHLGLSALSLGVAAGCVYIARYISDRINNIFGIATGVFCFIVYVGFYIWAGLPIPGD